MKYSFTGRIRFSEVDGSTHLTLPAMINYLQDCATFHGEEGGIGVLWNLQHDKTWVLASLRLHIYQYPLVAEEIKVTTWAAGFRGFLGYRDFVIQAADGALIAEGKSDWVFMEHMKAARVPEKQINGYGVEPESALEEKFGKRKIHLPKEGGKEGKPFVIAESHLDTNGHVNNGQYVRLSGLFLPAGFRPHTFRAEYKNQAFLGDVVLPTVYEEKDRYLVTFGNCEGKLFFIGEFGRELPQED
jgi:medium-chain acyl-[acyl-carrier-protein] hydrolase